MNVEVDPGTTPDRPSALRLGQLLTLLGLTGFAISQPLLSLAGENPTLFTFARVEGSSLIAFALTVALVPPLVMWVGVVVLGAVNRRAGDVLFVLISAVLMAATVVQWARSSGIDRRWILGLIALLVTTAFVVLLSRFGPIVTWTRYTAPLPALAVVLLLFASPAGDLLRGPDAVVAASANDTPPLVFVMLDEFPLSSVLSPDGGMDRVRFPNLSMLGDEATWYPNYTVMAPSTLQSLPSMLTGKLPNGDPPLWTSHPDNLFSLLAPTHRLRVSETVTRLCGYASCGLDDGESDGRGAGIGSLLGQMVDVWKERVALSPAKGVDLGQFHEEVVPLDPADVVEEDFDWAGRPERVSRFLESLRPSAVPGLHYLHVMLPHQPWSYYPDGRSYEGFDFFLDGSTMVYDEWGMSQLQQAHLFQARYADRLLGQVVDRMKETGLYESAVLVVVSDHGVNFSTPPNLRQLDDDTIGDVGYVPLIIKGADQTEGVVDRSNLMGVDLLPTIASSLGLEIDWDVDGYAVGSPEIAARGDEKVIYNYGGAMDGGFKGVLEFDAAGTRPLPGDRLIGPSEPGDHILQSLLATIGADPYLGMDMSDLAPVAEGGRVSIDIARLEAPNDDDRLRGRTHGEVGEPERGDLVVVVVNGVVESAALVRDDGRFETLLPPDALDPSGNEVDLVQVGADANHLLEVS